MRGVTWQLLVTGTLKSASEAEALTWLENYNWKLFVKLNMTFLTLIRLEVLIHPKQAQNLSFPLQPNIHRSIIPYCCMNINLLVWHAGTL
jgi:hypothetical protein